MLKMSAWEKEVDSYLKGQKERGNIRYYAREFRFKALSSKRRFDFIIGAQNGTFLLELDGSQHFKDLKTRKCKDDLKKRKSIDLLKSEMAMMQGLPLVRIAPSHRLYTKTIIKECIKACEDKRLELLRCYGEEYKDSLINLLEPTIKIKDSKIRKPRKKKSLVS